MEFDTIFTIIGVIASVATAFATIATYFFYKESRRAKVIFDLIKEEDMIIPELTNIGDEEACDIKISTNPPLRVVIEHDKYFEGHKNILCLNMEDSGIKTLFSKKTIREKGFPISKFKLQFVSYKTMVVKVTYKSGKKQKEYNDWWHIDLEPLTAIQ